MKNTDKRIEKRYMIIILSTLVMGFCSIFSWLYISNFDLLRGSSLTHVLLDIALLSAAAISFFKFFYYVLKKAYSYFSTSESMNDKERTDEIIFGKESYKEVKYILKEGIQYNTVSLKFYARKVNENRICLIARNKEGNIIHKEYISYDYFMKNFSTP